MSRTINLTVILAMAILLFLNQSHGQMYHYSNGWNAGGKRSVNNRYNNKGLSSSHKYGRQTDTSLNQDSQETDEDIRFPLDLLKRFSNKCRVKSSLQNLIITLLEVSGSNMTLIE